MIRAEFMVAGCILTVPGVIAMGIGYGKTQPTPFENAVSVAESASGRAAPTELHPSKTPGYLLLELG